MLLDTMDCAMNYSQSINKSINQLSFYFIWTSPFHR